MTFLVLWLVLAGAVSAAPQPRPNTLAPHASTRDRESRILIKPKAGTPDAELARFHSRSGCRLARQFPDLGNIQVLEVPQFESAPGLISKYAASGLVDYAEPDYRLHIATTFANDPKFLDGTLWALNNAGQNGGKPNADIDAPEAWARHFSASNIVVAVIDTGIRYTHEDLIANIWHNPVDGSPGTNAVAGTDDPLDDNGHGTLVAGIIGASGNNGLGTAGVAWHVQMMACKFADSSGDGVVSDAISCLEYARTHGAQVINASWGSEDFSLSLSNAVLAAQAAGIILVAAAGNNSQDNDLFPFYPASFVLDNVVSVAATTRTDAFYFLSNYGTTNVHLAAPGYEIYSTSFDSDHSYAFDEGTSMAAAYVTGSMALLRSAFPSETHSQLIHRLLEAVDPVPALAQLCATGGRLNLRKALGVTDAPPSLQIIAASPSTQVRLTGSPGRNYVIEAGNNLVGWNPVSTNLSDFYGNLAYSENPPPAAARRFYRALLLSP